MIIGFTGTRHGMTREQYTALYWFMYDMIDRHNPSYGELEGRHGDCVGGDEQFHGICRELKFTRIVVHPPRDPKLRAYCQGDYIHYPREYKDRNQDIVAASNFVIGAPNSKQYQPKGGTWQTIKMSENAGNLCAIVFPDGAVVKG